MRKDFIESSKNMDLRMDKQIIAICGTLTGLLARGFTDRVFYPKNTLPFDEDSLKNLSDSDIEKLKSLERPGMLDDLYPSQSKWGKKVILNYNFNASEHKFYEYAYNFIMVLYCCNSTHSRPI